MYPSHYIYIVNNISCTYYEASPTHCILWDMGISLLRIGNRFVLHSCYTIVPMLGNKIMNSSIKNNEVFIHSFTERTHKLYHLVWPISPPRAPDRPKYVYHLSIFPATSTNENTGFRFIHHVNQTGPTNYTTPWYIPWIFLYLVCTHISVIV